MIKFGDEYRNYMDRVQMMKIIVGIRLPQERLL